MPIVSPVCFGDKSKLAVPRYCASGMQSDVSEATAVQRPVTMAAGPAIFYLWQSLPRLLQPCSSGTWLGCSV